MKPLTRIGTTSEMPTLGVKIDPNDSAYQLWFLGDEQIMRMTAAQARKMAGLAIKIADRQDELARGGARIVVPAR